jgi:beta-lactamase superfamily II metal-dependent hydrolase
VAILLTGDAEIPSEEGMLVAGILLDIDVLKVGHHGSRTSTSDEFLGVIAPEVGVISAGLNSQYGHPNQEVVDRLTEAGVELWHTDISELDDTVGLVSDCGVFALEQPGR